MEKVVRDRTGFKYSVGEDRANWISHTVGVAFSIVAIVILTVKGAMSGHVNELLSGMFFGITIFLMFGSSTMYHAMRNPKAKKVWRILDHCAIYLVILGSFAPVVFVAVQTTFAYVIFYILSGLSLIGIIMKTKFAGKFKILSTIIFLAMGWSVILFMTKVGTYSTTAMVLIICSGAPYTIGAIIYAAGKFKYSHLVWHISIMMGITLHFIAVYGFILN